MKVSISFRTFVIAAVLLPRPGVAETPACPEEPLNRRIAAFEATDSSVFEAILALGHQSGISMGLMGWETALFDKRVDLRLDNPTVGEVLSDVLAPLEGVDLNETGGVIAMSLNDVSEPQWLSQELVGFTFGRSQLQIVSSRLFRRLRIMQLRMIEDGTVSGIVGSMGGRLGDPNDLVGPFVEERTTVLGFLNRIVCTSSQGALWIAHATPPTEFLVPSKRSYWTVLGYSEGLEVNLKIAERRREELRRREAPAR